MPAQCASDGSAGTRITNYVTINDVANAVLACGASPIMADEPEDVEEITAICGASTSTSATSTNRR
jgi:hydroxyethylthiazole kinase-like sugar kinase family protein